MRRRRRYFTDADFDAFATEYADSDEPAIIRARKRVVEEKFRPLHEGFGGAVGLGDFMARNLPGVPRSTRSQHGLGFTTRCPFTT